VSVYFYPFCPFTESAEEPGKTEPYIDDLPPRTLVDIPDAKPDSNSDTAAAVTDEEAASDDTAANEELSTPSPSSANVDSVSRENDTELSEYRIKSVIGNGYSLL